MVTDPIYIIVGGFLATVGGIFVAYYRQYLKEKRDKKYIAIALLLEIKENQKHLLPLVNIENVEEQKIDDIITKNIVSFDRTIYSSLSNKIGLLHFDVSERVVRYYTELRPIEDGIKTIIPTFTIKDLKTTCPNAPYLQFVPDNKKKRELLKNTNDTYNIGEELIRDLESLKNKKSRFLIWK